MNSRFKMVPVGILTHLLHCGDTATTITPYLTARLRELLEAPAPPAGDVEVLATLDRSCDSGVTLTDTGASWHMDGTDLVDIDHVTRLTAERDGLLGNCADLSSRVRELEHKMDYWKTQNAALQSELTKARECITKIAMWPDGGNAYGQDKIKAFANRILSGTELHKATEIAHQSAPAAKGGTR